MSSVRGEHRSSTANLLLNRDRVPSLEMEQLVRARRESYLQRAYVSVPGTFDIFPAESAYRRTVRGLPERDAVAVRVRDRLRVLADRPDLRRVRGAVVDVERLGRRAGDDAVRGDAPVPVHDLAGLPGAGVGVERGAVRGGAVAWGGCDQD